MTNEEKARETLRRLRLRFPEARTELKYKSGFQLLVATILSAQCTDVRVNEVTKELFKRYKTAGELAKAKRKEIEKIIKSCGLYTMKARNIIKTSKIIAERHKGKLPAKREDLELFPGVGRKTANIILAEVHGAPTFAVDTHIRRVTQRIGFVNSGDVRKIEDEMVKLIPDSERRGAHHLFIFLGRYICKARNPDCPHCPLTDLCAYFYLQNLKK
ncbi:MAG: hypothetical protein Kow0090_06190 [Myxococcota bacterium]